MKRKVSEIIKGLSAEELELVCEFVETRAQQLMHERWDAIVNPIESKFFELNALIDSAELGIADSFFKEHGGENDSSRV